MQIFPIYHFKKSLYINMSERPDSQTVHQSVRSTGWTGNVAMPPTPQQASEEGELTLNAVEVNLEA